MVQHSIFHGINKKENIVILVEESLEGIEANGTLLKPRNDITLWILNSNWVKYFKDPLGYFLSVCETSTNGETRIGWEGRFHRFGNWFIESRWHDGHMKKFCYNKKNNMLRMEIVVPEPENDFRTTFIEHCVYDKNNNRLIYDNSDGYCQTYSYDQDNNVFMIKIITF
jgi:hypothetical protein